MTRKQCQNLHTFSPSGAFSEHFTEGASYFPLCATYTHLPDGEEVVCCDSQCCSYLSETDNASDCCTCAQPPTARHVPTPELCCCRCSCGDSANSSPLSSRSTRSTAFTQRSSSRGGGIQHNRRQVERPECTPRRALGEATPLSKHSSRQAVATLPNPAASRRTSEGTDAQVRRSTPGVRASSDAQQERAYKFCGSNMYAVFPSTPKSSYRNLTLPLRSGSRDVEVIAKSVARSRIRPSKPTKTTQTPPRRTAKVRIAIERSIPTPRR